MSEKSPTVQSSDSPTVYAGIDAGGSRSEIVLVDSALTVLMRFAGPAAAVRSDNIASVANTISAGLQEALRRAHRSAVRALVVGAAGAGRPREQQALESA